VRDHSFRSTGVERGELGNAGVVRERTRGNDLRGASEHSTIDAAERGSIERYRDRTTDLRPVERDGGGVDSERCERRIWPQSQHEIRVAARGERLGDRKIECHIDS